MKTNSKVVKSGIALLLLLLNFAFLAAQSRLFTPWEASPFEARLGAATFLTSNHLELHLGSYIPLFSPAPRWSIGAEGFTISRLRSESHFKFPVELIDYYFGLDLQTAHANASIPWQLRLRLGHISAHVVDGGIDTFTPFVYSQEFLSATLRLQFPNFHLLGELTYLFSVLPETLFPLQPALGGTLILPIGSIQLLLSYQLRIVGIDNTHYLNHRTVLQIHSLHFPLQLYLSLYNGKSYHGMLYSRNERFATIGFQFTP